MLLPEVTLLLLLPSRFANITALERMGKSSGKSKAEVRAEAGGVAGAECWAGEAEGGDPTLQHRGSFAGQLQPWLLVLALCVWGLLCSKHPDLPLTGSNLLLNPWS